MQQHERMTVGIEIYLDVETLRLSDEVPGGWANVKDFGLAVGVTWDAEHGFRHWFEKDAERLVTELAQFSRIITFNGERFDFQVLRGYTEVGKLYARSFDLHTYLQAQVGHRVKFDLLAQATLGRGKSGSGVEAVAWWRAGKTTEVVRYCQDDVQMLVDIVTFGRRHGYVLIDSERVNANW